MNGRVVDYADEHLVYHPGLELAPFHLVSWLGMIMEKVSDQNDLIFDAKSSSR